MADPRFEVPPEYADVYERAFRAAYEERHGDGADVPPRRTDVRMPRQRRDSVPQEHGAEPDATARSSFRSAGLRGTHDALAARDAEVRATIRSAEAPEPDDGFSGAKRHRERSSVMPLLLVGIAAVAALAVAFGLGWASSGLG